ncbi:MAG: hypothetical protein QM639_00120 [Rhodocyclaceae bacterium]
MNTATRFALCTVAMWCLTGFVAWLGFAPPTARTPAVPAASRAEIEVPPKPDLRQAVRWLERTPVWGAAPAASASEAKTATETWSRIAVVLDKRGNYVLLAPPQGAAKRFGVGDTLPDGGRLLALDARQATVRTAAGVTRRIALLD